MATDVPVGIDLLYNNDIVCPYCGNRDDQGYEQQLGDGDTTEDNCPACDKTYRITVCIDVTYSTEKIVGEESDG